MIEDLEPSATASEQENAAEDNAENNVDEIISEDTQDDNFSEGQKTYSEEDVERIKRSAADKAVKNVTKRYKSQSDNMLYELKQQITDLQNRLAGNNLSYNQTNNASNENDDEFKRKLLQVVSEAKKEEITKKIQDRDRKLLSKVTYLADTIDDFNDVMVKNVDPTLEKIPSLMEICKKHQNSPEILYKIGKNHPEKIKHLQSLPEDEVEQEFWRLLVKYEDAEKSIADKKSNSEVKTLAIEGAGNAAVYGDYVSSDDAYFKTLKRLRGK